MMKHLFIVFLALFIGQLWTVAKAQSVIDYSYDDAGNRKTREIHLDGGGSKGVSDEKEVAKKEPIVDDSFTLGEIKIYPNPTSGNLEIEIPDDPESKGDELKIIVWDVSGRKVMEKTKQSTITNVDLSSQPNGLYILHLIKGNTVSQWRIIKK